MRHRWNITVPFLGLLFTTLTPTFAQTELRSVTGTGAVSSSDGVYQVQATLGQSAIGLTSATGRTLSQGFWHARSNVASVTAPTIGTSTAALHASPNPFLGSTRITVQVPQREHVSLTMHDLLGRPVRTLLDGEQREGEITISLAAENLPAGRYTLTLATADDEETIPLLLVK